MGSKNVWRSKNPASARQHLVIEVRRRTNSINCDIEQVSILQRLFIDIALGNNIGNSILCKCILSQYILGLCFEIIFPFGQCWFWKRVNIQLSSVIIRDIKVFKMFLKIVGSSRIRSLLVDDFWIVFNHGIFVWTNCWFRGRWTHCFLSNNNSNNNNNKNLNRRQSILLRCVSFLFYFIFIIKINQQKGDNKIIGWKRIKWHQSWNLYTYLDKDGFLGGRKNKK